MNNLYQSEHFYVEELINFTQGDDKHFIVVNKVNGRAIVDKNRLLLKMTKHDCMEMIKQIEKIYHYFNE